MRRCVILMASGLTLLGVGCGGGGGGSDSSDAPAWVNEEREAISGDFELSDTPETVEFEGETLYVFEGKEGPSVVVTEDCTAADAAVSANQVSAGFCVERGSGGFQLLGG